MLVELGRMFSWSSMLTLMALIRKWFDLKCKHLLETSQAPDRPHCASIHKEKL